MVDRHPVGCSLDPVPVPAQVSRDSFIHTHTLECDMWLLVVIGTPSKPNHTSLTSSKCMRFHVYYEHTHTHSQAHNRAPPSDRVRFPARVAHASPKHTHTHTLAHATHAERASVHANRRADRARECCDCCCWVFKRCTKIRRFTSV